MAEEDRKENSSGLTVDNSTLFDSSPENSHSAQTSSSNSTSIIVNKSETDGNPDKSNNQTEASSSALNSKPTSDNMSPENGGSESGKKNIEEEEEEEEEKIVPQKSQSLNIKNPFSSSSKRQQIHRTDNFRKIIRRKSSKDTVSTNTTTTSSFDETKRQAMTGGEDEFMKLTMSQENALNESLEKEEEEDNFTGTRSNSANRGHLSLNRASMDSMDSTSMSIEKYIEGFNVSSTASGAGDEWLTSSTATSLTTAGLDEIDGDPLISRPVPNAIPDLQNVAKATPDEDEISEASTTNTEDGINDSITNMELLKSYLYGITTYMLSSLWGLLSSGVQYIYEKYIVPSDAIDHSGGSEAASRDSALEGDAEENLAKQALLAEKDRKRIYNIVRELLSTEQEYVKRLGILVKIKSRTSEILQADVARSMFQNIEVIHQFHRDNLLPQLQDRINKWEVTPKIGDIMRNLAPFLKLYTEYVKNFTAANALFETSKQKSSNFSNFVVEAENSADFGRLKVQAHMLEPVQRVPRYELLLKDYLKKIPETSEDKDDAEEALKLVSSAAKHFEEMMKRDTRILELMKLQTQFEGAVNLVAPNREFVQQGKVKLINVKAGKISDRVLHLFNDLLLVSSEQRYIVPGMSDKFKVKYTMTLQNSKVVYGNNLEIPHTFYVKNSDQTLELAAGSAQDRKQWIDIISCKISSCQDNDVSDSQQPANYNETTTDDGFLLQRYTFQVTSDNKSWKKRCLSLYDNGLIAMSRNQSEKQHMSSVHVCNFKSSLTNTQPQQNRKGKTIILASDYKTYQLYDDNVDFVEGWYKAIYSLSNKYDTDTTRKDFSNGKEEVDIIRKSSDVLGLNNESPSSSEETWTVIPSDRKTVRLSTISSDSGVDVSSISSQQSVVS